MTDITTVTNVKLFSVKTVSVKKNIVLAVYGIYGFGVDPVGNYHYLFLRNTLFHYIFLKALAYYDYFIGISVRIIFNSSADFPYK